MPIDAAADTVDPSPSPEELALGEADRHVLRQLLAQLPADQQRIVELRLAGLTNVESAQALGRSCGAVTVAYHRALTRLRTLLEDSVATQEGHRGRS